MHSSSKGQRRNGLALLLLLAGMASGCGDDESTGPEEPDIVRLSFSGDGFDDWAGIPVRGALFVEGEASPVEVAEDTVSQVGGAWFFPGWDVERAATHRLDVYLDVNEDGSCVEVDDVMWSFERRPDASLTIVTLFPPTAVEPSACLGLNAAF